MFKEIRSILSKTSLKPISLLLPSLCGIGASVFEALSVVFLIPIVNATIRLDTSYIKDMPFVGNLIVAYPFFFKSSSSIFLFAVICVFAVVLLKISLSYGANLASTYLVRRFANDLRELIFEKYLSYGKKFFDRSSSGQLYQILITHTQVLGNQLYGVQSLSTNLFMLIAYFVVLFYINWKITFFSLLIFPILHFSLAWLIEKIKKTSQDHAVAQIELGEKMSNALSCIELVKSYCNEESEKEIFNKISRKSFWFEYSIGKKMNLIPPLQELITLVSVMVLLLVIAGMARHSQDASIVGKFLVYFYVLRRASNAFGTFNNMKGMMSAIAGPWHDIVDILKTNETYLVSSGNKEFVGINKGIFVKGLRFDYNGTTQILNGMTANFPMGRMTALVGHTGAGKTTVVNIIMRYYECPANMVFMDDTDIRQFSIKSLRSKIAIVSQDAFLFNATIKENILYGLQRNVSDEELLSVVKKARLYDFIMNAKDKFETVVGDRGVQLSGGERQRISIARAMLKKAEIFILDEATSALDSKTEALIQAAIDELIDGKTTIVIAHRLSTVKKADHVIVLDHGCVIEEGAPQVLIEKKGIFFEFLEAQKFK